MKRKLGPSFSPPSLPTNQPNHHKTTHTHLNPPPPPHTHTIKCQDADNVVILQRHQGRHYLDLKKNRFDGDLGIVPLEFRRVRTTRKGEKGLREGAGMDVCTAILFLPPPSRLRLFLFPTGGRLTDRLANRAIVAYADAHTNTNTNTAQQDTGTLKEVENARLASTLVHEEVGALSWAVCLVCGIQNMCVCVYVNRVWCPLSLVH
jgi:hypothetical protein